MINRFLTENTASMKLARTLVQAACGVLVQAASVGEFKMEQLICPMVIALLTPIMAEMGKANDQSN